VKVINKKAVLDFAAVKPEALRPLIAWYVVTTAAAWKNFVDLRVGFPRADQVGRRTVFNIGGNKFRLIARVNYEFARVYILHILTHAEYDKERRK
jgi:mRNA interferase HigB